MTKASVETPALRAGDKVPTPAPSEPTPAHPLLERAIPLAVLGLFVLATLGAFYVARAVLLPTVLGLVLSLVLTPVVRALRRLHVPRVAAVVLVLVGATAAAVWGIYQLTAPAQMWFEKAPEYLDQIEYKLGFLKEPLQDIQNASEQISEATKVPDGKEEPIPVTVKAPTFSDSVLSLTGSALSTTLVTLVLIYFFLAAGDSLFRRTIEILPRLKDKKRAVEVAREIERGISTYLFSIAVINLVLGAAVATAMWFLGMPNPILWGVMAAAFNFIPYLGAMVGIVIVGLVAIVSFDTLSYALLAPAIYFVLNALEGNFITPSILGRRLDLNPLVIFLWLLLWGWLWGVAGAIIAVPLLVAIKIFCDYVEPLAPIGHFLVR